MRPKGMPLNPDYVIFYSPGKVGSTSVMETLRTVNVPCHRCTNHNIDQYHRKDWPTITAVREPISWAISHMFEKLLARNLLPIQPEEVSRLTGSSDFTNSLEYYCDWLTNKYRQTTGINIYGNRWVKKIPWKIYSMRGLVVRTDKINDVMEEALNEFLPQYYPEIDMSTLEVQHRAKGTDRFDGYEEFMDAVKFDAHWLANFYDKNKLCNYFFFRDELRELVMKWATGK
jgi:hypothetical protein